MLMRTANRDTSKPSRKSEAGFIKEGGTRQCELQMCGAHGNWRGSAAADKQQLGRSDSNSDGGSERGVRGSEGGVRGREGRSEGGAGG